MKKEKSKLTFRAAVNWEYIHAHHKSKDGAVTPGEWCQRIIAHARSNGYTGEITERGACRIINANLY